MAFSTLFLEHWKQIIGSHTTHTVVITGQSLTLADVVLVARHEGVAILADSSVQGIKQGAIAVEKALADGKIIYGVNTGFGGSADTRTEATSALQREIIRGLHYGLADDPLTLPNFFQSSRTANAAGEKVARLPLSHENNSMPDAWVRAIMLIRLNSLSAGASGVRLDTVEILMRLLEKNIIPRVPVHGSISASGDLSPLSYIGGTMQGKCTIHVNCGVHGARRLERADVALSRAAIRPIVLGAKEGLAIVNGTAASAALGSLAIHEAMSLAVVSQVLTAMSVEALLGTDESFDPYFAHVRPHPGQRDAATTILGLLQGSSLVQHGDGSEESSLRQDRYSIRTASQWIGPVLEDLSLAYTQTTTEINSVTDNPLVDVAHNQARVIHGGNFQARSITSATEKIRQCSQSIGRMLFSQCTELINPTTNRGLPPNLVFDEPNESFIWKGTDILVAALVSELGFLANPVGTHVQTAEMGNQALNSLALISARYALDALRILSHLSAAHLVALCQALDLRAMHLSFLKLLESDIRQIFFARFSEPSQRTMEIEELFDACWSIFTQRLARLTNLNSDKRFAEAWSACLPVLIGATSVSPMKSLLDWVDEATRTSLNVYSATKAQYFNHPDATPYLGIAARRMYNFVRKRLLIPFVGNRTIETPDNELAEGEIPQSTDDNYRRGLTVGDMISQVHQAIQSGLLYQEIVACVREAHA